MAPTIAVDADPTQVDGSTPPDALTAPLAPLGQPLQLLSPSALDALVRDQLAGALEARRALRGDVQVPEDAHNLIRNLDDVAGIIGRYRDVFVGLAKLVDAELLAEHAAAVGVGRDGVPRDSMDVVATDGTTIKFTREWTRIHEIDRGQAVAAAAGLVTHEWRARGGDPAADPEGFATAVVECVGEHLLGTAATKVLITKLEGLIAVLGERKLDHLASVANGAYVGTSTEFDKVKIERVAPKQEKPKRTRITRKTVRK